MLDPFLPSPRYLADVIQPIADRLGLFTLPLHFHEVIFAWACYHLIYALISPIVSTRLSPSSYSSLSSRARLDWDTHFTSLIQSCFITIFALVVIRNDEERKQMDWAGRIWGYTGAGGAVQGFAAGYFLWDLTVGILHLRVLGWGSLAHATCALLVTSLGFRPFANYYGLNFILYEISTPFLNIHWFCEKCKLTGSRLQLYNGIALLLTFFLSRVVWGNYQSLLIYSDIWKALTVQDVDSKLAINDLLLAHRSGPPRMTIGDGSDNIALPIWLAFVYLASNTVLNVLNIYWFTTMIRAVGERLESRQPVSKIGKFDSDNLVERDVS